MKPATAVNTLRYDPRLCTGCGLCEVVCPRGVFSASGTRPILLRPERCIECGACSLNCPAAAIAVDSGVGCARALIKAVFLGREDKNCCGGPEATCCR